MKISHPFGVKNQTVITDGMGRRWFISYETPIAVFPGGKVTLNTKWQWSKTTSKYLGKFLNENTKAIEAKISSGEYTTDNLIDKFNRL